MLALGQTGVTLKSPQEIELMRHSGSIVAATMEKVLAAVKPGVSTAELDAIAEEDIRAQDAIPSFKGYLDYPATLCTSLNEELVHGIPAADRIVEEGDILSIDAGAIYKGFHSDYAVTIAIGAVSEQTQTMIDATRGSLDAAIQAARGGARIGDVSAAVQEYVESRGFGVVREYVGHGVGRELHQEPQVPNFGPRDRGMVLKKGLVIAIEPMVTIGDWHTTVHPDGWTVSTLDNSLCAHFEHTIVITDGEAEILTSL